MESMMWFLIATPLVAILTGVLGTDDNCNKHTWQVCAPEERFEFPETEKAFDETCPILVNFYKCMEEHATSCDKDHEDISTYLEVLEDVCRKDSRLHEALASKTGCIKKSLADECTNDTNRVYMAYRDFIEGDAGTDEISDEDRKKIYCLSQAYEVLCASDAVARHCGKAVTDALLELALRTDYMDKKQICSRNVREEAAKDIPHLQIGVMKQLQLQELLLLED